MNDVSSPDVVKITLPEELANWLIDEADQAMRDPQLQFSALMRVASTTVSQANVEAALQLRQHRKSPYSFALAPSLAAHFGELAAQRDLSLDDICTIKVMRERERVYNSRVQHGEELNARLR